MIQYRAYKQTMKWIIMLLEIQTKCGKNQYDQSHNTRHARRDARPDRQWQDGDR